MAMATVSGMAMFTLRVQKPEAMAGKSIRPSAINVTAVQGKQNDARRQGKQEQQRKNRVILGLRIAAPKNRKERNQNTGGQSTDGKRPDPHPRYQESNGNARQEIWCSATEIT